MIRKWFPTYVTTLRVLFSLILLGFVVHYVLVSIHWPVMWDTSIMHYVNFLMAHGLAPYRDIIDNNLPGSYFVEGWAMQVFGTGDLGWRLYDYTLLAIVVVSLVAIAWPYDWFAGLLAGVFFVMLHASEGPRNAAQREQVMMTLIIAGYAFLFSGLRRATPWMFLPFGLLMGIATSLKPTAAPLAVILLGMTAYALHKRKMPFWRYLGYAGAGLSIAVAFEVTYLVRLHAFAQFLDLAGHLTKYYANSGNSTLGVLLPRILAPSKLRMLAAGVVLTVLIKPKLEWEQWERSALILGACFGFCSYMVQRKYFEHHEYVFVIFLYAWACIELAKAFKTPAWLHAVGLAFFAAIVLRTIPYLNLVMTDTDTSNVQTQQIVADLERFGGSALQHDVQCFDEVDGCYSALNHLGLLPYTTFLGDYMFFPVPGDPPLPWAREKMAAAFAQRPPRVIVMTNMWLAPNSWTKIDQWPELERYVNAHYTLEDAETHGKSAFRFYVLKDPQAAKADRL